MRRAIWGLGGAVTVLAAACGTGHRQSVLPSTTAAPAASTTATTSSAQDVVDPVPAVITVPYVNAVLAQLEAVYGNASRLLVRSRSVSPLVLSDLRAIFNDPEYGAQTQIFRQAAAQPIRGVRAVPGNRVTTVVRGVTMSRSCIFVQTKTDYSQVDVTTVPGRGTEFFTLHPKQAGVDPAHLNHTPWAIAGTASYPTSVQEPDQCDS